MPELSVYMCVIAILLTELHHCQGQTYATVKSIYDDLLSPNRYQTQVRPLLNQSHMISVSVVFEVLSIVEIDEVSQSFKCNGFIWLSWRDEMLVWEPGQYEGKKVINMPPADIWKPRIAIMNTLGDRDLFKDDHSHLRVTSDGLVTWIPGSLFPASCKLDLTFYPFDVQMCDIMMAPLQHSSTELRFVPLLKEVGSLFYKSNGEWELLSSQIMTFDKDVEIEFLPIVKVTFHLKRRPAFILVNIILPVVLLMFLNILVFLIPVESGEKISYGITVQLALAVFLSVVSESLPRVSDTIPILMMYLYTINFLSVLTVIASIAVVFLHKIEGDGKNDKETTINTSKQLTLVKPAHPPRNAVVPLGLVDCLKEGEKNRDSSYRTSSSSVKTSERLSSQPNHRKWVWQGITCGSKSRCINISAFCVFLFIWFVLTVGFLLRSSRTVKKM